MKRLRILRQRRQVEISSVASESVVACSNSEAQVLNIDTDSEQSTQSQAESGVKSLIRTGVATCAFVIVVKYKNRQVYLIFQYFYSALLSHTLETCDKSFYLYLHKERIRAQVLFVRTPEGSVNDGSSGRGFFFVVETKGWILDAKRAPD